jgi:prepilin-type N-terminal cleavage/methylation domain-containing protein
MAKESGFTIVEVMIAIVVLVVGMLGVAAMQTKALQANVFAGRVTEGCAVGEAWMEWLMKQPYDRIAALDADYTDTAATALTVPCDSSTAISSFQTWGLGTFTEEQLPNPRNAGSTMTWRITADYPIENTTTVEINTAVAIKKIDAASSTSPTVTKPVVLRFTRSRHM